MTAKAMFIEQGAKVQAENYDEIDFRQSTEDLFRNAEEEPKKYSWQDLREHINIFCNLSLRIFYICCSVLQFFATMAGFSHIFPSHNIFAAIVSLPLALFPIVGTLFGIWGAYTAWGWYLSHATIVFVTPYFIVLGPMYMISIVEFCRDVNRWQAEKRILKNSQIEF